MSRRPAVQTRQTETISDCDPPVFEMKQKTMQKAWAIPEHLNRCLTVTDKAEGAWQKRVIRCKRNRLKSVCRELPAWRWLHACGACIVCM
jgi:hypothetical protein